jgi:hypothetical protein
VEADRVPSPLERRGNMSRSLALYDVLVRWTSIDVVVTLGVAKETHYGQRSHRGKR